MINKVNILPADTYMLVSKNIFSEHDRKLITMLYQPIIGPLATNIYLTFWSFLERREKEEKRWSHYHLMTSMRVNLDAIIEAREKLEGIGLLKTYINDNDKSLSNIIYEVYAPVSAYEFFSSPLLNTLLINNIGKNEYDEILKYYQIHNFDFSGYKEITCSFSEIYKIKDIEVAKNITENIEKNEINKIKVKSNIDLKSVISLIPDEMLNKKSITKDTIDLINNLSYVYNLNDEQMKDIIINSIDAAHRIDKEKIRYNASNLYKFNNNGKVSSAVYQKQPESLKNTSLDNSKKNKKIYSFENTSPYDFLSNKYGNIKPAKTDLKIIEYLLVELKLTPGVVNVLIDYVLKTNNNKLTKAYIETIAGQWKRSNINTVIEAIEFAKKEYTSKRSSKTRTVKKVNAPKWLNENVESSIATKEEQEQMSNMLKELVGEK